MAVHAYVLPAKQILTFMIDHFGTVDTLVVCQKTVLYDLAQGEGIREVEETLYYGFPNRFRSEVISPGIEQVRLVNQDSTLIVIDGKIIREMENQFDYFKDLLLYRETELLVDRLSKLGVDLEVVSLGRFKDNIAYVIGGKYPDESVPQVWIARDTFRPLRFILSSGDAEDASLIEIEYTDYRALDKGKSYPGRILFFEDGILIRMQILDTFDINPEISDQLFDVEYLRSVSEPIVPAESAALPASELDGVRKGIQDFKNMFE